MRRIGQIVLRLVLAFAVIGTVVVSPQRVAWGAPQTRITPMLDLPTGKAVSLPFPATHVVVRWDGAVDAVVQIRGQRNDGTLTAWQNATTDEDGGATQESGLLLVDDIVKLEGRVVSGNAEGVRATAIDAQNGPRKLEVVGDQASALDGATTQPPIVARSAWGADESLRKGTPEFAPVQRLDIHHTVTANNDPDPASTVRAIYAWHTQGNGWNDIGYNFLIDQNGRIYEGRYARPYASGETPTGENEFKLGVIGAHTLNNNTGTVGIALLGTFNTAAPTAAQQASLVKLLAWEADRHGIDPMASGSILGHRDLYSTECPGDGAYALLPSLRQKTAALVTISATPGKTPGYWIAGTNGAVRPYGTAKNLGSMEGKSLNASVISMAATPSNNGYWLLGSDGGIFSFGDAQFYGSTGNIKLNKPIVGMARTPSGKGYWLVASDGGIFAYGDAQFYGSTGAMTLNKPVVAMASTPSGKGYWLVASDGGIFAYGDAQFYGSTGSLKLNSPVVTIAGAPNGNGYWLVARDGGVFAFNTKFYGSVPGLALSSYAGTAQVATTSTGKGYYMLSANGGIFTFGDAKFLGASSVNAASLVVLPES